MGWLSRTTGRTTIVDVPRMQRARAVEFDVSGLRDCAELDLDVQRWHTEIDAALSADTESEARAACLRARQIELVWWCEPSETRRVERILFGDPLEPHAGGGISALQGMRR